METFAVSTEYFSVSRFHGTVQLLASYSSKFCVDHLFPFPNHIISRFSAKQRYASNAQQRQQRKRFPKRPSLTKRGVDHMAQPQTTLVAFK